MKTTDSKYDIDEDKEGRARTYDQEIYHKKIHQLELDSLERDIKKFKSKKASWYFFAIFYL